MPSRSSMIATSAGAPTLSVPRSSKAGNTRAAFDGCCRNDLAQRHAEHEELRHDIRQVDDAGGPRHDVPVGRESVGPEVLLGCLLHRVPVEMIDNAVAEVEDDAAAARGHHVREQTPLSSSMLCGPAHTYG